MLYCIQKVKKSTDNSMTRVILEKKRELSNTKLLKALFIYSDKVEYKIVLHRSDHWPITNWLTVTQCLGVNSVGRLRTHTHPPFYTSILW